jgi:hypothetical protein
MPLGRPRKMPSTIAGDTCLGRPPTIPSINPEGFSPAALVAFLSLFRCLEEAGIFLFKGNIFIFQYIEFMEVLFGYGRPFEVRHMVICFVAIYMIHRGLVLRVRDKHESNKAMYLKIHLFVVK